MNSFTERARALLCGVLINQVSFLKGTVELYKLTKILFNSKLMAHTSSMMFLLSPATIFLCVMYVIEITSNVLNINL